MRLARLQNILHLVAVYAATAAATREGTHRKELLPLLPAHLQNLSHPSSPVLARHQERKMHSQIDIGTLTHVERQGLQWEKQIEYSGETFFDGWEFFTAPDPTHGLINYVSREKAFKDGLVFWTNEQIPGLQVEHWKDTPVGTSRDSVRIHTKALFAGGLFIIDLKLMPWGCSVWPAFWTLGYEKEWPYAGEIDIIEGIHSFTNNHSLPGCSIKADPNLYTGRMIVRVQYMAIAENEGSGSCDSTNGNSGCSIVSSSDTSYGMKFNELGGGAFAMLWDGDGIKMWDWTRSRIPKDILEDRPEPGVWGKPAAAFDASTCNPWEFFGPQQLILNINLCGQWAGALYDQYEYCPGTCEEYASNHLNLNNTVMLVNSIKVYQQSGSDQSLKEAEGISNLTGVGAPIPGSSVNTNRRPSIGYPKLSLYSRSTTATVLYIVWLAAGI